MIDVKIVPVNQLYVRLECDAGLGYEIAEEFSFYVPGYKFMPTFKSGRWDGRVKLFNRQTHQIYRGLLPKVCSWLTEQKYLFEIENKAALRPVVPYDAEWLNHWAEYSKFEPRDYQIKAFEGAMRLNQAMVLSPTSSGKSLIIYLMIQYMLEKNEGDILLIVPRTALVEQMYTDFQDYEVEAGWTENNCHRIHSGADKATGKRVIITTWQSIFRLKPTWFAGFSTLLCDEAHEADAKSITGIVDNMKNAPVRIGLTGTLDGTVMHAYEMEGRFGPILKYVTTKQLMDEGHIAPLEITCFRLQYSKEDAEIVHHLDYQGEIDFLITHEKRNKFMVNLALNSTGNTLMLFNFIDRHGKMILEMLAKKAAEKGKRIHYIDGSVAVKAREEIRAILEKEDNAILLASFGTLSTGTNIKNLHNAIFCHPYKAKIKILQSIGRILRLAAGKGTATLFDFGDDLVYKTKKGTEKINITMRHFIERIQSYQSEQFTYKIVTVPISG